MHDAPVAQQRGFLTPPNRMYCLSVSSLVLSAHSTCGPRFRSGKQCKASPLCAACCTCCTACASNHRLLTPLLKDANWRRRACITFPVLQPHVLLRELRSREQIATERLRGKSVRECSNAAARALGIVRDFSRIEIFGRPRVCTTPQCREYDTLARKIRTAPCRKLAENAAKTGLFTV